MYTAGTGKPGYLTASGNSQARVLELLLLHTEGQHIHLGHSIPSTDLNMANSTTVYGRDRLWYYIKKQKQVMFSPMCMVARTLGTK